MVFSKYPSGGEMLKNSLISTVLFLPAFSLPAMYIKACGDQVVLSGAVEVEDFDRVSPFLSENPNLKTAVLRNSPGEMPLADIARLHFTVTTNLTMSLFLLNLNSLAICK
jgi:hypothetical protein